jgi:hypothetical protein
VSEKASHRQSFVEFVSNFGFAIRPLGLDAESVGYGSKDFAKSDRLEYVFGVRPNINTPKRAKPGIPAVTDKPTLRHRELLRKAA